MFRHFEFQLSVTAKQSCDNVIDILSTTLTTVNIRNFAVSKVTVRLLQLISYNHFEMVKEEHDKFDAFE